MPLPPAVRLAVLCIALLLAVPTAAPAATVDLAGGALRVVAAPGERNDLVVTADAAGLTVTEASPSAALAAGGGCSRPDAGRVTCPGGVAGRVEVDLGDLDDRVRLATVGLATTVVDGTGDDLVVGSARGDRFLGSPGDDVVDGGAGDDRFGDAGGPGADRLAGGPGADLADFSGRTEGLVVTLDDRPGDGAAGEGDDVRADVEHVAGGSGADRLVGSDAANRLDGNGGADVFDGRGGPDHFEGNDGDDVADYSARLAPVSVDPYGADDGELGEGDDVRSDVDGVLGGAGDDVLTGNGWSGVFRGGAGDDEIRAGDRDDEVDGGPGRDALHGDGGHDDLRGGPGADADLLDGGDGDDDLDGGLGPDALHGGPGRDAADFSARRVALVVDLERDEPVGEPGEGDRVGDDVEGVLGGAGDDRLLGDDAAGRFDGGAGDDVIDGRGDGDRMAGGPGADRVEYAGRSAGVEVDADDAADDGQRGERDDVRSDVEGIAGTPHGDRLRGTDDADRLTGGDGRDTLEGRDGADRLDGGPGDDTTWGHGGDDELLGGPGNDRSRGDAGDDRLVAGDGADHASGGAGADTLAGEAGNDVLEGQDGPDALDGDAGADRLRGDEGDDRLAGGDDPDQIEGGRGADALAGGGGGDRLSGHEDPDVIDGGDGEDRLSGGSGADRLDAGAGADDARGDVGDDLIAAGDGADDLGGGPGSDLLDGGPADDDLHGHEDADVLRAGDGDDRANGDAGADRLEGGAGQDELGGGGEADVLAGGPGADDMRGDDGDDLVDYGDRRAPVRVTNDDAADDGERGEGDRVDDTVDGAIGGAGGDTLRFTNGWHHDLSGEGGADVLVGGPREDRLRGGAGRDRLSGGGGIDAHDGGDGGDTIRAADGRRESVRCGPGRDLAVRDRRDVLVACERRKRGRVRAPDVAPAPADTVPAAPAPAPAASTGTRIARRGGRIADIPGSPGERIDARLLRDVAHLKARYRIAVTDGYALHGHARNGEHPLGLAIDVVPGPGGSWDEVDRLARWAEPAPGRARPPFRFVGYNGDPGHGRGHHLHLSWRHAPAGYGRRAAWVEVMRLGSAAGRSHSRGAGGVRDLRALAARTNPQLGGAPSLRTGLHPRPRCRGAAQLVPTFRAAARSFGLRWTVLAAISEIESGHGCNLGPSSAGAIGWTQFLPATWRIYGMDADGDRRASPYSSVDAIFATARYLRASGAPRSYRRALFAYNHADWYVRSVLARARRYR